MEIKSADTKRKLLAMLRAYRSSPATQIGTGSLLGGAGAYGLDAALRKHPGPGASSGEQSSDRLKRIGSTLFGSLSGGLAGRGVGAGLTRMHNSGMSRARTLARALRGLDKSMASIVNPLGPSPWQRGVSPFKDGISPFQKTVNPWQDGDIA